MVITIGVTGQGAAADPAALDAALGRIRTRLERAFRDAWTVVSACETEVERATVRCLLERTGSRLVGLRPGQPAGARDPELAALLDGADEVIDLPSATSPIQLLADLADVTLVLGAPGAGSEDALGVLRDRGSALVWLDVTTDDPPTFERVPAHPDDEVLPVTEDGVLDVLRGKFPRAAAPTFSRMLARGSVRRHPAGEVLCKQGEQEDRFAVVVDGELEVTMDQGDRRTTVATLPAGASLGGLEYFTGTPRIADVVATEPAVLLSMSFADVDAIVAEDPEILRSISTEVITELLTSQSTFMTLLGGHPAPSVEHEVFISYARTDLDFAQRVATGLRRFGVTTWLDVHNIRAGLSWARQVGEALDRCTAMVLVISPASMSSENSDDEWNYFLDKGHPIIPVLLEEAPRPYRLNKLQYIDFSSTSFDAALTKLVVAIHNTRAEG